jgi:hypothetical protein
MNGKQAKATMNDIAALTHQRPETVRRHHQEGWFSMDSFESVVAYTQAHMVLAKLEPKTERR